MTALAAARRVLRYGSEAVPLLQNYPVKGTTKIWPGAIVCLNASGLAIPGATATSLIAVGIALELADNSAGADSAITVQVEQGVHDFTNSAAGDAIAQADVGKDCYIVDDQTVAKTDGSAARSRAGKVIRIEGGRVYVQMGIGL
jgi:hypothetical protein